MTKTVWTVLEVPVSVNMNNKKYQPSLILNSREQFF